MDNQGFRVVLTGQLMEGFAREPVLASLSRLFQTSAAKIADVFEGGEHPIRDVLGKHEALALQKRIERLGAKARVETAASDVANDALILPVDDTPPDAGLMHCPACGHKQLVSKRCDECGVVFADYNRQHRAGPVVAETQSANPFPHTARPVKTAPQKPRDIHAAASDGWRDDWLEEDSVPTEQYHVNLFMGMRSADLSETCEKMMLGRRTRMMLSWVPGAFLSPFLWAMYRKMWAWGTVIFAVEILLPVVLITLGAKEGMSDKLVYAGLALLLINRLFWPAVLKNLYCRHARRTIRYMHRLAPTYASDIDIATRGGTSRTSAFVGLVLGIVVSLLSWSVMDTLYANVIKPTPEFTTPATLPSDPPPLLPNGGATQPPIDLQATAPNNENRWVATRNRLRLLGQSINAWFADRGAGVDPQSFDMAGLAAAMSLDAESMRDGWGREVSYLPEGQGYVLRSAGPDGEFGTADDVEYRRILQR
ncbi:DUF2628 domain-containing protein [Thiosocius teredinicola]|uniref:DUF2628 domain-containing protein n=1 Tax=Thiosocius teredinicola TaxID=1973002 RepID=UPI000990A4C2